MTTDNEYTDMGICPRCLSHDFDGVCDKCGYIEGTERMDYPYPEPKERDDYDYLLNSEGD